MVEPWSTHGRPGSTHGRPIVDPWSTHGRPMVSPWSTHGTWRSAICAQQSAVLTPDLLGVSLLPLVSPASGMTPGIDTPRIKQRYTRSKGCCLDTRLSKSLCCPLCPLPRHDTWECDTNTRRVFVAPCVPCHGMTPGMDTPRIKSAIRAQ